MWKALSSFLLKALGALSAYFIVRKGGKTAQKLKDAQRGLQQAGEANETREEIMRMSDGQLNDELLKSQRD